jgi:hypothetical protein
MDSDSGDDRRQEGWGKVFFTSWVGAIFNFPKLMLELGEIAELLCKLRHFGETLIERNASFMCGCWNARGSIFHFALDLLGELGVSPSWPKFCLYGHYYGIWYHWGNIFFNIFFQVTPTYYTSLERSWEELTESAVFRAEFACLGAVLPIKLEKYRDDNDASPMSHFCH